MDEVIRREFPAVLMPTGDGRTLDIRVIPYGETAKVRDGAGPVYEETWLPGVFERQESAPNRVLVNVEHEQGFGGVVGRGIELRDAQDGFHGEFRMLAGPDGDKALELVNEGVLTGVSVEAVPISSKRDANGVVQRVKARLINIALCRFPAFAGAEVLAVREQPEPDEPDKPDDDKPEPQKAEQSENVRRSEVDELLERVGFEPIAIRAVTRKAWDGSAARYEDTAAYCKACLIDNNPAGEEKVQSRCSLPVYEPNGDLNANAVHAAAARLNQVQASGKTAAARKLVRLYRQLGEEAPPSVRAAAAR
jgi:HK97 family phage prohead protease